MQAYLHWKGAEFSAIHEKNLSGEWILESTSHHWLCFSLGSGGLTELLIRSGKAPLQPMVQGKIWPITWSKDLKGCIVKIKPGTENRKNIRKKLLKDLQKEICSYWIILLHHYFADIITNQ